MKNKKIIISVVVTTYQRPLALNCVLESLANQSSNASDFEVIIADDGSNDKTKKVINLWSYKSPYQIKHYWQEDLGFRAARARNKATLLASGNYLIFIDGDCIVFPDFIKRHIQLAEENCMVIGSRILCSQDFTKEIEMGSHDLKKWGLMSWVKAKLHRKINRIFPLIRLGNIPLRKLRPTRWQGVRAFNLAVWKEDFFNVNGFDERFQGWGHEDADLAVRLINNQVKRKDGQFSLPVLHLWHKENDRSLLAKNVDLLREVILQKRSKAVIGLNNKIN
jgi:glycosyltransferase involved in cell wall biosynthesis